jgi:4-diphosphocytidyl-2-C-methyl-D-erythritol kinase
MARLESVSVTARAPGKVNLELRVGGLRSDGFHPLATVFQAVELGEEVSVRAAPPGSGIIVEVVNGALANDVPLDRTNLVWRAAELVSEAIGRSSDCRISINKQVPVAGGMAGGSADAAAALVALAALWDAGLGPEELSRLALNLGSDVPFALLGGTALGLGRGEDLRALSVGGPLHWVFATAHRGMATPEVYRTFDELNRPGVGRDPQPNPAVLAALEAGDVTALARAMHNDLEAPALSLRPELSRVIELGESAGALRGMVSGSGPTVALLCADAAGAQGVAAAVGRLHDVRSVHQTTGPARGAAVVSRGA